MMWKDGWTPLHLAVAFKREAVAALVAAGEDVNARIKGVGATPLHLATVGDTDVEVLTTLISAGADVNARDREGLTPLHAAAEFNKAEVVSVLAAEGANVNARDKIKRTPLHAAAEHGKAKVISALAAAGADVDARDKIKRTPLHVAAAFNRAKPVAALIASGSDPGARARFRFTPLHFAACHNSRPKVVNALVAAGEDINALAIARLTPLRCASILKKPKMVSALLAAGADADAGFKGGDTPPDTDGRDETERKRRAFAMAIVSLVPDRMIVVWAWLAFLAWHNLAAAAKHGGARSERSTGGGRRTGEPRLRGCGRSRGDPDAIAEAVHGIFLTDRQDCV